MSEYKWKKEKNICTMSNLWENISGSIRNIN